MADTTSQNTLSQSEGSQGAQQPVSSVQNVTQQTPPAPAQQAVDLTQHAAQSAQQGMQNATTAVNQTAQVAQQGVQQASQIVTGGVQQGVDTLKKIGVVDMFKPAENQPKVSSEEKIWAMVAYIPLVAVLSLLIKDKSDYVKLHGRQGLLMFLVFFFCFFVYLIPYIGALFGGLVQFLIFVLGVFSMYQALIGNWWKIPVLGDIAEMIPTDFFATVTKEVITGQAAPQDQDQSQVQPDQNQQVPPTV